MKYIKTYEQSNYKGKYWKVRTDEPYLSKSLEYLDVTPGRFYFMLDPEWREERKDLTPYIFIILTYRSHRSHSWGWDINKYVVKGYEYMGNLEKLTPEDLEEIETKQDAKKYNL
jgi:hypothetical protein